MTSRYDIYRNIHMALRANMAEVLLAVGRMDPEDMAERADVLSQVQALVDFCRMHLAKEDKFLHPAMEARAPGSASQTLGDHAHHKTDFEALDAAVAAVEMATPGTRQGPALALYRSLALFVGENFVHMHVEETANNEVLWRTHSDAEIIAIEQAIVAALTPEQKPRSLRWMLTAISPAARAEILGMLRHALPPQALAGILAMIRPHLSDSHWRKLGVDTKAA
jgi:hypothetical protein